LVIATEHGLIQAGQIINILDCVGHYIYVVIIYFCHVACTQSQTIFRLSLMVLPRNGNKAIVGCLPGIPILSFKSDWDLQTLHQKWGAGGPVGGLRNTQTHTQIIRQM
jgi:hypothetical protein